eukprot:gene3887-4497_t
MKAYPWKHDFSEIQHIEAAKPNGSSPTISVLDWLIAYIPLNDYFEYHNVSANETFLYVSQDSHYLPFELYGTTDIVITPADSCRFLKTKTYVSIQLKKSINENSTYQAWCQLIVAGIRSPSHPVLQVLTDLDGMWEFSWWSAPLTISYGVLGLEQAKIFIQEYLHQFTPCFQKSGVEFDKKSVKVANIELHAFETPAKRPLPSRCCRLG